jgi:hypothetical protein
MKKLLGALAMGALVAGGTVCAAPAQADPCGGAYTPWGGGAQCDFNFTAAGHTHCVHVVAPFVNTWNCSWVPN